MGSSLGPCGAEEDTQGDGGPGHREDGDGHEACSVVVSRCGRYVAVTGNTTHIFEAADKFSRVDDCSINEDVELLTMY